MRLLVNKVKMPEFQNTNLALILFPSITTTRACLTHLSSWDLSKLWETKRRSVITTRRMRSGRGWRGPTLRCTPTRPSSSSGASTRSGSSSTTSRPPWWRQGSIFFPKAWQWHNCTDSNFGRIFTPESRRLKCSTSWWMKVTLTWTFQILCTLSR